MLTAKTAVAQCRDSLELWQSDDYYRISEVITRGLPFQAQLKHSVICFYRQPPLKA